MKQHELIYDWNIQGKTLERPTKKIEFDDETLRDGMQSPTIKNPLIDDKIKILHLMNELGIDSADIGLPGAGPMVVKDVTVLAKEISNNKLKIKASCAARTVEADIAPIVEISQKAGIPVCVDMFIGSSTIRSYAENWSMERMLKNTRDSVKFAKDNNIPVMYVTEDTTRAHPETIRALYKCAIDNGAERICVCDTVGHATPSGIRNLVKFVKDIINETGADVKLDFHGHNDRGLALNNTIDAIIAGVDRVHGCGQGIGERSGNTPMDLLLVNLKLLGWIDNVLTKLPEYCRVIGETCDMPMPCNYPVLGMDAFRTATGVHAATVIKAMKKESDVWLADAVYCGVPASMVGLKQRIEIGPMSGKSNVIFWLEDRNINPTDELVEMVFNKAKQANTILSEDEINKIIIGMFRKKEVVA